MIESDAELVQKRAFFKGLTNAYLAQELSMTLTKADLVEKISVNGLSKKQSSDVMGLLLEIMKKTFEQGEDILISGFGKFCVKEKNKRREEILPQEKTCIWMRGGGYISALRKVEG